MIKEFSQVGWFNPGSRRFEYTDIRDDRIKRGQGEDGYTVPVFAIDKGTASRLQITMELAATDSQQLKAAIAAKMSMLHANYQPSEQFSRDQVITMLRLLTAV